MKNTSRQKMYVCEKNIENFGDLLNKTLFEKLFSMKFDFIEKYYEAEIIAIGSLLETFMYSNNELIRIYQFYRIISKKIKKIEVLGSGFHYEPEKCRFVRKMNFRIVRGRLTEQILRKHDLINRDVVLGDLGLLASYYNIKNDPKYLLGIIPHFNDLNSPIFYDIYKKYKNESILINVRDEPEKVIGEISECKNIISSSLHGLIVADSFGIPNIWIENKYKPVKEENRFKYRDYYSSISVEDISPIQAFDFLENGIELIKNKYQVDYKIVEQKQKELYNYCKEYFESKKNRT
jgi:hypothetical protein